MFNQQNEFNQGERAMDNYLLIMTQENIDEIQRRIGYTFNHPFLLVQAFVRKSFSEESRIFKDNEKLEFIGDKVLDFIVVKKLTEMFGMYSEWSCPAEYAARIAKNALPDGTEWIVERGLDFALSEGEMTELKKQVVQTRFLAGRIADLGLEKYLIMSKGDALNNVQSEPHVMEDLFEAIVGAIAIDSNWNIPVVENVVERLMNLEYHLRFGVDDEIDYVSYVHDWHQKEYKRAPEYKFYDEPDENGLLWCWLSFDGRTESFEGSGNSKKEAIRLAAKRAYSYIVEESKTHNLILETIGSFDLDTAIGKLQILADKRIISGVEYIFREEKPTEATNGNPMWYCECRVEGVDRFVEYGDVKKINAKKYAAFTMLEILTTGRDIFMEIIRGEN